MFTVILCIYIPVVLKSSVDFDNDTPTARMLLASLDDKNSEVINLSCLAAETAS